MVCMSQIYLSDQCIRSNSIYQILFSVKIVDSPGNKEIQDVVRIEKKFFQQHYIYRMFYMVRIFTAGDRRIFVSL